MNIFKTPQEMAEYIPHCLICGKEMNFSMDGTISPLGKAQSRYSHGNEHIRLRMNLRDGILYAKHKKHDVNIELATGKVIAGQDLFNRFYMPSVKIMKTCGTCDFKLEALVVEQLDGQFPVCSLRSERLHYTLKGGKEVVIVKYHNSKSVSIQVSGKSLPEIQFEFDFAKFKNLAHLNQRLGTILLFQ
jgi:hypothetical protein